MRKLFVVLALLLAAAMPAAAQRINLDFPGLAEKADDVIDVTLDANMLKMASKFLQKDDPDQRAVRDMVNGLEGIYVRSYTFAAEGQYDRGLIDRVKSQLGPNWKPMVTVRSKKKENVNIYAEMRGDRVTGLVVIAAEPKEFTVVNIVGPIDIEKLASLEGQFGIPKVSEKEKEKNHD